MSRLKERDQRLTLLIGLGFHIERVKRGKKHYQAFVIAPDGRRTMFVLNTSTSRRIPDYLSAEARRFLRIS